MSNPGVILLVSLEKMIGFPYRFDIEDNIGEAIHVHFKDLRLDMTIHDFELFADSVGRIFTDIIDNESFDLEYFDENNLVELVPMLLQLDYIDESNVDLENIMVDTIQNGEEKYKPLKYSRVIKALYGDSVEDNNRKQENYYSDQLHRKITNEERVIFNKNLIENEGYPSGKQLITLLGSNNHIIDGQHRAATLYYLYGNKSVPVRRLFLKCDLDDIERPIHNTKSIYDYYEELRREHHMLEARYHDLDTILNERDRIIANYQEEIKVLQANYHDLDEILNERDRIIEKYQSEIGNLQGKYHDLDMILNERDKIIESYQHAVQEANEKIANLKNEIEKLEGHPFYALQKKYWR